VQIIFQNPADAFNPRETIATAIARPSRSLRGLSRSAAHAEVHRLLELVRLPSHLANRYPRELSGGELQRVGIARALAAHPDVVICDEITSALDVSVQAAILKLLLELRADLGLAMLFITHDFSVVTLIADDVMVLKEGRVCESGAIAAVLGKPADPYTRQLLECAPSISHVLGEWDARDVAELSEGRGL
jgi:peptide/nickel transport system ATP-binding protein